MIIFNHLHCRLGNNIIQLCNIISIAIAYKHNIKINVKKLKFFDLSVIEKYFNKYNNSEIITDDKNLFFRNSKLSFPNAIFEQNIEEKIDPVLESPEWKQLEKDFSESSDIYIVANGGLWAVGNHAADDCTRLFAKAGIEKSINNLDSQCLITSLANDYGWNNLFLRWLELQRKTGKMKDDAMILGLSCSGGSKNVV